MRCFLLALLVLAGLLTPAGPALAQDGSYVECAGFSPRTVREACERAVPEGIPVGAVDTGRRATAAPPTMEGAWRAVPWLLAATLGLAGAVVWRRRPGG